MTPTYSTENGEKLFLYPSAQHRSASGGNKGRALMLPRATLKDAMCSCRPAKVVLHDTAERTLRLLHITFLTEFRGGRAIGIFCYSMKHLVGA